MISPDFVKWVTPLLYEHEADILPYLKPSKRGFGVRGWHYLINKHNLKYEEMRLILWRLNFFAILFELEVAAGLVL